MMKTSHSYQCRLPANQFDVYSFDSILELFEQEYDHLICQADLGPTFVITEDPAVFRDALSEQTRATNIRVRGWTREGTASVRLGELLLTDHRAEIRVDGYGGRAAAAAFVGSVRDATRVARRPLGWLYAPWLLAVGCVAGAVIGLAFTRGAGSPSWPAWVVAATIGALAGLTLPLIACSIAQLAVPYAGVKGFGLRPGTRLDVRQRLHRTDESGSGRGVA